MVKLSTTRPDTATVHNLACQQYHANVVLKRKKKLMMTFCTYR